jgi:hypothetical protein
MKLDGPRLAIDLTNTAIALKTLKREIRRPRHQTTSQQGTQLYLLRRRATALCALRAASRGRVHRVGDTPETQRAYLEETLARDATLRVLVILDAAPAQAV